MGTSSRHLALLLALAAFVALFPLGPVPTYAITSWQLDPDSQGSWHEADNWTAGVPNADMDAVIDNGGQAKIDSSDAQARSLTISGPDNDWPNVTHSDFHLTVSGALTLGQTASSFGDYGLTDALGGGTTALTVGTLVAGHGGTGYFGQDGGSVTVQNDLVLGSQTDSRGDYSMVEGTFNGGWSTDPASLNVGGSIIVGQEGEGFLGQEGSVRVQHDLVLGSGTTAHGEYSLWQGTYTDHSDGSSWSTGPAFLNVEGSLIVGQEGEGFFAQSGGSVTVQNDLVVGSQADADGQYKISEGTYTSDTHSLIDSSAFLNVGGSLIVGNLGVGWFGQGGGSVTVQHDLVVGSQADAFCWYSMWQGTNTTLEEITGPAFLNVQGSLIVGLQGEGGFFQSGGSVMVQNDLVLGSQTNAIGSYDLSEITAEDWSTSAASLMVGGSLIVGQLGEGNFYQSGGSVTVQDDLILGREASATGGYFMREGDVSGEGVFTTGDAFLNVQGSLVLGQLGLGDFRQAGGSVTVSQDLILGWDGIASGSYSLWQGSGYQEPWFDEIITGPATLDVQGSLIVGDQGDGNFSQSGGSVTVGSGSMGGNLILGNQAVIDSGGSPQPSTGTYSLADSDSGTATLNVQGSMILGNQGEGYFTQDGGSVSVTQDLILGNLVTRDASGYIVERGYSDYDLQDNGGSAFLNVQGSMIVGNQGEGYFTQEGGSVSVGKDLIIGSQTLQDPDGFSYPSIGDYFILEGLGQGFDTGPAYLSVQGSLISGQQGDGYFGQMGGFVTVGSGSMGGDLILGQQTNSYGEYSIYFGEGNNFSPAFLNVQGSLIAGQQGWGEFRQGGGSVTVTQDLILGQQADATGAYQIFESTEVGYSTGSSLLNVQGSLIAGQQGTGAFSHYGGSVTVQNDLILGSQATAFGNYLMIEAPEEGDGPAYLNVQGSLIAGQQGEGRFEQYGGSVAVQNDLIMGSQASASGSYYMWEYTETWNDGSSYSTASAYLNVGGSLIAGQQGEGRFEQYGGSVAVQNDLILGSQANAFGNCKIEEYTQDWDDGSIYITASAYLNVGGSLIVGQLGEGEFQQGGGSVTVQNDLVLGSQTNAFGFYDMWEGSYSEEGYSWSTGPSSLNVGGSLILGDQGSADFQQDGGSVSVTQNLILGNQGPGTYDPYNGALGGYSLANGFVTVDQDLIVGGGGLGAVLQGGGEVAVWGNLILGRDFKSLGGYKLSEDYNPGASLTVSGTVEVGVGGLGGFYQTAGLHSVTGDVILGSGSAGLGVYRLEGGTLWAQNLIVGLAAAGGTFNLPNEISTPWGNIPTSEFLDYYGLGDLYTNPFTGSGGNFIQSGGEVAVQKVELGSQPGSTGAYELSGNGVLDAPYVMVGLQGQGTFTQSGGSLTSTEIMVLGQEAGAGGTYTLQDGTLNAQSITVGLKGAGAFTQSGGSLTVDNTLAVNDRTEPGNTTGSGTFTQTGGTSNINNVKNWGQVNFDGSSATLSATIGDMTNYGAVKVTTATVTFANYTEHGSYHSDPATTIITGNLTIGDTGYLVGGSGDTWQIAGNFYNTSTRKSDWQTSQATLVFTYGNDTDDHELQIPGLDMGKNFSGYDKNFAWGALNLTSQDLFLVDDVPSSGGALYLGVIVGLKFAPSDPLQITNIFSEDGLNLYYNPFLLENKDLAGLTYKLTDGGYLAPAVPLPGSVWLLLTGLVGLGLARRWRPGKS